MILTFLYLLFIFQIKNVIGESGFEKDTNLQLSQLLINRDFNKQVNSLATANLPSGFGFPPLYGQAIAIPNGLSNDMQPLGADFNNLLGNIRTPQNINSLPVHALEFQENGANNILKLKKNVALINNGPQQIDYNANSILNNYLSSTVVNSNNLPTKDNRLNGIQLINAASNIPTTQHVSNNKPLTKNQYANMPLSNLQQQMLIMNDMQKRNSLSGTTINPMIQSNRNNQLSDQVTINSPGLSNDVTWNNNFLNMYPTMSDLKPNQHITKLPFSISYDIPFDINNGKENTWFLGNDIPARYTQQSDSTPGVLTMKNNDLPLLNIPFNNPFNCGFNLDQLPEIEKQFQIDNSLLNILMSKNKSPTNSRLIVNKDDIQNSQISKPRNLVNCNFLPNGNIMPSQLVFNGNNVPSDKQVLNFNNLLQNNLGNQNCPIISKIDGQLSDIPDFYNYISPVIASLPISDRDLRNCNTPVCLANTNVLNLGEFGSLPIINGLPVASIVETVTVLNPNVNFT